MNKELSQAYFILRRSTPLRGDCGRLCSSRCCRGDSETGMLLFPHERELFEGREGFTVKPTADGEALLICPGWCERDARPLACRIFPLFPAVYEENGQTVLRVIRDPRAQAICPLFDARLDAGFAGAVRLAARYLLRDAETREFMLHRSALLADTVGSLLG